MDRRDFIRLTAATGVTGALAACGHPELPLIRFVPDDDVTPGIAEWKPSVCPLCPGGCGLTVRVMAADVDVVCDGRAGIVRRAVAKQLVGQPAHPINQGGLCPRGHAAVQVTYHPDRIAQPLLRAGSRGDGRYVSIPWEEAVAKLVAELDALASSGRQDAVRFLAPGGHSRRHRLVERFLGAFGAPPPLRVELFDDDVVRRANALSFGRARLPTIDLPRARLVLSFGADLLGTWNSPVSQAAGYGVMRQPQGGVRGTLIQVEPRLSLTGANADEWIPVRPGTEGALALGLAHVILAEGLEVRGDAARAGALIEGWNEGLPGFGPGEVEAMTGLPARRIVELARHLSGTTPAVAIAAGAPLAQTNGLFTALAVNALHALVGGVDRPGGLFFMPEIDQAAPAVADRQTSGTPSLDRLAASILDAPETPVALVLIDGVNPVFTAPPRWRVSEALTRVPFIVSFGSFLDETSVLADLILPDHSFLESWVDSLPESGALTAVAGVAPPVMQPLHDTRAMPDVLLEVSRRLARPLADALPWDSFEAMLADAFRSLPPPAADRDPWTEAVARGGWWGEAPAVEAPSADGSDAAGHRPLAFREAAFDGDPRQYPYHLVPFPSLAFFDGSLAHLPWLQELPDPLTSAMWSSWVEMNVDAAAGLGIARGDIVEISSSQGSIRAPAIPSPGLAPDVVAMPVGQGHRTFTRYASGRGVNPVEILAPLVESETGVFAWAATRVSLARVGPADGRLVLFAGELREHPHVER